MAAEAGKIQITSEQTIQNTEINALISGSKIILEGYDAEGNYFVVIGVPIYGVKDSVAKTVFKPVDKEDFPPPSENKIVAGNYTGLIIDCGDTELNPVLSPVVRDATNKSIYSYNNLDYDKVISKGMVGYEKNSDEKILLLNSTGTKIFKQIGGSILLASDEKISRAGSNPLIIKAQSLDADNTCPIVSEDDADRILAENQISHFLDEGSVVFTSNRIRGMRL